MKKVHVEVLHHSSYIKLNLPQAIEKGRYLLYYVNLAILWKLCVSYIKLNAVLTITNLS